MRCGGPLAQTMGPRGAKRRASTVVRGRAGHCHGEGCGIRAAVGRAGGAGRTQVAILIHDIFRPLWEGAWFRSCLMLSRANLRCQGHAVFQGDAHESQRLERLGSPPTACCRNVRRACPSSQAKRGVASCGQDVGHVTTAPWCAIRVAGHIADPGRVGLHLPLPAHHAEHAPGCRSCDRSRWPNAVPLRPTALRVCR